MGYDLKNIGNKQLDPPVMDKVDMDYYGCSCGCDENFRMNQMYQCPDCLCYIANEHREIHDEECPEREQ